LQLIFIFLDYRRYINFDFTRGIIYMPLIKTFTC